MKYYSFTDGYHLAIKRFESMEAAEAYAEHTFSRSVRINRFKDDEFTRMIFNLD